MAPVSITSALRATAEVAEAAEAWPGESSQFSSSSKIHLSCDEVAAVPYQRAKNVSYKEGSHFSIAGG